KIHPSRVVRFIGRPQGSDPLAIDGWGDSVLNAVWSTILHTDSTVANVASMVFEANVDVIQIPDFMRQVGSPQYREQVMQRLTLAATAKGINGALLLDKDEEYTRNSASFSGLDAVMDRFFQVASGAAN